MSKTKFIAFIALAALATACSASTPNQPVANNVVSNIKPADSTANTTNANTQNVAPEKAQDKPAAFTKKMEMHGITLEVTSPNSAVGNRVTVTAAGLTRQNEPAWSEVDGAVYDAEIGDLNVDRSPEVYIYYRSSKDRERSGVVAFAVNGRASLSQFALPDPREDDKNYSGYRGQDKFAVVENVLTRNFPIFDGAGTEAVKTGKTRQIQYKIAPGEATWKFTVHRVSEY